MKVFQTVLLGVFIALAVGGLIAFATFRGGDSTENAQIVLWGTVSNSAFLEMSDKARTAGIKNMNIKYVQKNIETFDQELVEAIASGAGPDAVILPNDLIIRYTDKITPIPYTNLSQTDFKNTFAQIGEIYMTDNGILALPFSADPYVMYWNRGLFNVVGKTQPPTYWDEFPGLVSLFSQFDKSKNIQKSAVAMGEYRNVNHAKNILSLLMLQAGSDMVSKTTNGYSANLNQSGGTGYYPASSALIFYTDFANSGKNTYSWNRSLPVAQNKFLADELALYFGPVSEYTSIANKNPNLNFAVTLIPQKRSANYPITIADLLGVAILKSSANQQAAYDNISLLTGATVASIWSDVTSQVPVRRDLLSVLPNDSVRALAFKSALISETWLDPNGPKTDIYFRDLIESVTTGKVTPTEAVSRLNDQLNLLLAKKQD